MADNHMISKAAKLNRKITFDVWLHRTKLQLIAKSPQGVILENALEEAHGLADNNYKKARTILLDCIEDDDLMAVIDMPDIRDIIAYLRRKYVGNVKSRAKTLLSQFGKLKLEKGQTVSALVEKALDLGRQLLTVRQPQSEVAIAMAILNAMPAEYATTVERLIDGGGDNDDDDLTVERVRSSLLMKENQLADGIPPKLETKALMAVEARVGEKRKGEDYYKGVCFKCGYPLTSNHWSKHCTNKRVKPGFVPMYGYQSAGAGDRASKWQRQREAGRGR
jgi:hypothetical protein